jgi:hypothetical protein
MRLLPRTDTVPNKETYVSNDWRAERDDAVQEDISYFLICIENDRKTSYIDRKQPDKENRTTPQPDCVVKDQRTQHELAIEYSELRVPKEMPRLRREGGLVPTLAGPALANKLIEAIEQKRIKGQFRDYANAEKILLFRDWVSGRHSANNFFECAPYFVCPPDPGCDHCYVLLRRSGTITVVELF